jgi:hypothetical protein
MVLRWKNFLTQICRFNILFGAHHVEDVILLIFRLSKFMFLKKIELFQSSNLIIYVLYETSNESS